MNHEYWKKYLELLRLYTALLKAKWAITLCLFIDLKSKTKEHSLSITQFNAEKNQLLVQKKTSPCVATS